MIEDLAATEDFERRWVRKEPYKPGTPTDGGPFLIHCDGPCETKLGPYWNEPLGLIDAISLGWVTIAHKKMSGVVHYIYCPECKRKEQT